MKKQNFLKLTERVQIAIELGESHFREFKSAYEGPPQDKEPRKPKAVCVDVARTLVAFANADGGELLIGIEDDGTVTGIPYEDEALLLVLDSPQTHVHADTPLPTIRATKITYDRKSLLYFSVPKGSDSVYLTSDGRCLVRRDLESVPAASEQIQFSRAEIASREYDRAFVDGAKVTDLDIRHTGVIAEQISKGMSIEKCLQHLELAEFDGSSLRLRRAALLLFAKEPTKWHPRLHVRILKIDGTEINSGEAYNVTSDEDVNGNILSLIGSSWELLRPHLTETRFSSDAVFKKQIIYPELACREALTNAIAHRDYNIEGRGLEVRIFTDRMEIVSPGSLLSSIDIEDLRAHNGAHQSRNALISRVLREVGFMRELGEGMTRIFSLMHKNDLTPPLLESTNDTFTITLEHKYVYTKKEKLWLESFSDYDLSREQRTIVLLGYNDKPISPSQIWEAVGIVDTDYYRQLIESLHDLGILYNVATSKEAYNTARARGVDKKKIPRFAIRSPSGRQAPQEEKGTPRELDETEYTRIYVANIPFEASATEIQEALNPFGEVVEVITPVDRFTGQSRGFSFVEFSNAEAAERAVQASGEIELHSRRLYVQKAVPKGTEPDH